MPNFAFYGERKQGTTKFYFLDMSSTSEGFAYIWESRWVGIIAIKNERTQIHFLSDVLVAVASLDLKVPTVTVWERLPKTSCGSKSRNKANMAKRKATTSAPLITLATLHNCITVVKWRLSWDAYDVENTADKAIQCRIHTKNSSQQQIGRFWVNFARLDGNSMLDSR